MGETGTEKAIASESTMESDLRIAKAALRLLKIHASHRSRSEELLSSLRNHVSQKVSEQGAVPESDSPWPALTAAAKNLASVAPSVREKAIGSLPEEIRADLTRALFSFDLIPAHDPRTIQELLRTVNKRTLATALLGADEKLESTVLENMSSTAGEMLVEDKSSIERTEELRARDVQEARDEIGRAFEKLHDSGASGHQDG